MRRAAEARAARCDSPGCAVEYSIALLSPGRPGEHPLRVLDCTPRALPSRRRRRAGRVVDVTSVFTVAIAQLRRRWGRLSGRESAAVERGLATVLGLDLADPD